MCAVDEQGDALARVADAVQRDGSERGDGTTRRSAGERDLLHEAKGHIADIDGHDERGAERDRAGSGQRHRR